MIKIKYGNQFKSADLAGQITSETSERYGDESGIPDKSERSVTGQ